MSQHIAWYDFQFDVPDEWEVTAYSVERRVGRIEFSTRAGFQALVSWEPCKRAPDTETMMVSFLNERVAKVRGRGRMSLPDLRTCRAGPFLLGYTEPDLPAQAYACLDGSRKLLRWIFDPPAATPHALPDSWLPLLNSFRPNSADVRDYALFGLHFRLPSDYRIERMLAQPANVMIAFENPAHRRATFRRWGMPDLILDGEPLEVFYRRILRTNGCTVRDGRPDTILGRPGVTLRYEQRGEHQMDRFLGATWTGEARLWHDRDEKRLYAFEQIGPSKSVPLAFEEVFV